MLYLYLVPLKTTGIFTGFLWFSIIGLMEQNSKEFVAVVTPAQNKINATRASDAEILAVERHQKINMVWEYTQAYMAILVVTTVLFTCAYVAIQTKDEGKKTAALLFMTGLANLVAGFYFGRTNHTRPTGESK